MLSLIVAVAENGVIGRDNALPWHISEDLRYFKQVTSGKTVIMGRKTFQSIGRPLPNRTNIVVSRDRGFSADGVLVAHNLDEALGKAGDGEAVVIGGSSLFEEALKRADRFYLTEIHRAYDGDVHFPAWDRNAWREASRRLVAGDPDISFVTYERRH
ncbi:MAG TPA: dihydrofolate reductase [Magnetospirillaceae bacterium]|nr:dihydrofolate reductase [Magnetospirillaceae bacterium]